MKRCAVVGNPIAHSKSPVIHNIFADSAGIDLEYTKECVTEEDFDAYVNGFFATGGVGLNITLPYKERAYAMADILTDQAEAAKAANTLYCKDGKLVADNTDGVGMVGDITRRLGWEIRDKRVLIVGAGGAARGVVAPLLACSPESLTITNRTFAKAEQLANEFGVVATPLNNISEAFDLVISASSAGLVGEVVLPRQIIDARTKVYDMIYSDTQTPLLAWAKSLGAEDCSDGLGMLVAQAAESFARWFAITPDLGPAYAALR